jgi:hypothetical protein
MIQGTLGLMPLLQFWSFGMSGLEPGNFMAGKSTINIVLTANDQKLDVVNVVARVIKI